MIELLVLDVDGCLTDGKITYTQNGDEIKSFDVKDGLAIASWIKLGKKVAIITGRESQIVQRRAQELGITHLHQGIKDKKATLEKILEEYEFGLESVAGIGDDLNDLKLLTSIARSFAPQNAVSQIRNRVTHILTHNGGEGAVREMIEILLKEEQRYEAFLALWE